MLGETLKAHDPIHRAADFTFIGNKMFLERNMSLFKAYFDSWIAFARWKPYEFLSCNPISAAIRIKRVVLNLVDSMLKSFASSYTPKWAASIQL